MEFPQARSSLVLHNEVLFSREMLLEILADLSSRLLIAFGSPIRLITHGGAVMLLHPLLSGCRHSTRDVDIIKRAMVAEWRARGLVDADARLTTCIRQTAAAFNLGLDWMNADADVALPMAKDPQGRTYDPIAAASLNSSNLALHTIYSSPGLTLVAVAPFWAVALKLVRYKKHDPADIAALLRSGTRMNGVQWSREVLEGWLLNECWAMGYSSYPDWLVADMRERIKHAISLIENDPFLDAPPLYPPAGASIGQSGPAPQPFGSTRIPSAPLQEHTLVPPPAHVTSSWSHERSASMAAITSQPPPWAQEPPAPPRTPTPPPTLVHNMTPSGPPVNSHIHDMTHRPWTTRPQHLIPNQIHQRHNTLSMSMSMPALPVPQSTQISRQHTAPSNGPAPFGSGSSISMPFDTRPPQQSDNVSGSSLLFAPEAHAGANPPHMSMGGTRIATQQFPPGSHASQLSHSHSSRNSLSHFPFDSHSGMVSPPLQRPRTTTMIAPAPPFLGGPNSGSPTHPSPPSSRNSFSFGPPPTHFPPQFSTPPTQPALGRPAHIQQFIHSQQHFRPHSNSPQPTQFQHRPSHSHSHPSQMSIPQHQQLVIPTHHQRRSLSPSPRRAFPQHSETNEDGEPPVIPPEFTMGNTSRGGWSGLLPRMAIRA